MEFCQLFRRFLGNILDQKFHVPIFALLFFLECQEISNLFASNHAYMHNDVKNLNVFTQNVFKVYILNTSEKYSIYIMRCFKFPYKIALWESYASTYVCIVVYPSFFNLITAEVKIVIYIRNIFTRPFILFFMLIHRH